MKVDIIQGNTGCIAGDRILIGLYLTDPGHCILLDCGPCALRDDIEAALADAGLVPIGVFATHVHYDHFGNAAYFQKKYGIPVALSFGEAELCRTFPAIKSHLFAYPAGQIMSDPKLANLVCRADILIEEGCDSIELGGATFGILHTPGHSPDHLSILTPDGICYAGDALLSGRSLTGAKLPYAFNIRQNLETIEQFRTLDCEALILAHHGIIHAPFDTIVDENRDLFEDRLERIRRLIDHPMTTVDIAAAVKDAMGIVTETPEKAQNLERFMRPFLECLLDDHSIRIDVSSGALCYVSVD